MLRIPWQSEDTHSDSRGEIQLIEGQHFVFEGDSCIGDVSSIDFEQPLCILFFNCPDFYFTIMPM